MNQVVPLLKFTPSAQDPAVLETITVQREPLVAKLVGVAQDESGARHQLLIGPRGMGKTHILSLVANRVRARLDAGSLVVAWLEEDPWGVGSYEKFLAAIVARVADELSDRELTAKAEELHALRDSSGAVAEQVLRDALGDSRLVLLVENLDEVFRRIGTNGQERFRAFLENWRQAVVIATAPQLFEGIQLHESPFYGFFAITHLTELSLDSATELMRRVAELRGDEDLVKFLGSTVARRRLAAIEALAGGHPRIWLLLSGCVSIRAIDELVPLFLQALDDLTPYYQDRLRELGDQQQEVVVLLSEAGGALSNRALAERSGLPQNQIATILRQLATRGYVRRAEVSDRLATGDARMSFWELREPLMRLCLDVKQARGKPLRMVVEFLRAWYGPRLLDELVRLPEDESLAAAYVGEAFRMLEADLPIDDLLQGSPEEIVSRADRGLRLAPDRIDLSIARATGLLLGGRDAEARDSLDQLIETGLLDGLEGAIRGLRVVAEGRLGGGPAASGLLMQLVERTESNSAGLVAFLARSYRVLDLRSEALALFRKAADLDRSDPGALRDYGIVASQLGLYEEALEILTEGLELRPDSATAHADRSIVLRRLGRLDEAVAEAREAARLAPESADAQDALGSAFSAQNDFEAALAAAETAVRLDPANARVLSNLGVVLGVMGRTEEALEIFERAVRLDPEDPNYRANQALALNKLGRPSEALPLIERSLEQAPETLEFYLVLGQVLSRLRRYEESAEVLERAVAIAPEDANVARSLAIALRYAGRQEEALPSLRRAVQLGPDDPLSVGHLGGTLAELEQFPEALEVLRRAIELDPQNPLFRRNQCAVLTSLDRLDEALEAIEEALVLRPDNAEFHAVRGIALSNLDRYGEAIDAFERAIELDPEVSIIHERFAEVLLHEGRMEEALMEVDKTIELAPDDYETRNLKADLLRELGRLDEAEVAVAEARELAPEEYVPLFTAAEIAFARHEVEEALGRLREALRIWSSSPSGRPGETDLLCRILWQYPAGSQREEAIEEVVRIYAEAGAVGHLGAGLVGSVPLFVTASVSQDDADGWVSDWSRAGGGEEMEIPLSLLKAARDWKADRDRAHLLALPLEQREILAPLLGDSPDS